MSDGDRDIIYPEANRDGSLADRRIRLEKRRVVSAALRLTCSRNDLAERCGAGRPDATVAAASMDTKFFPEKAVCPHMKRPE